MSTLAQILINILANCAAILVASRLLSGFQFTGGYEDLFIAGIILGLVNSLIRPIIKILTFPFILLTLGLFSIIINITLLFLVDHLLESITISGFWSALGGVIIVSLVNSLILSIAKKKD